MNVTKFKKYVSVCVLAMSVGGTSIAFASPHAPELSPENRKKIEAIFDEHRVLTEATRKDLLVKKAQLKGELDSQTPDITKIQSLKTEIGTLEGKLLVDRVAVEQQLKKEGLPIRPRGHMKGKDFNDYCGGYDKGGMKSGHKGKAGMMDSRDHNPTMKNMHDE